MGKKRVIKTIARLIGGMAAHKLLIKRTHKPESINHLQSEINNYRGNLSNIVTEFNWSNRDMEIIKKEAEKSFMAELKESHFYDVIFSDSEMDKILDETIKEFFKE